MDYDILNNIPQEEMDKNLFVKFYKKAVYNSFRSKQQNKKVYDDIDYISIISPADRTSKVDRQVTDKDKERFSIIWKRYQNNEEARQNGIPIEMLPTLSPSQVENLKAYHVHTVEQLAGLQEPAIKKIHGGRKFVQDAEKYLSADNVTENLKKELEELKAEIAKLKGKKDEPIDDNSKRSK